MADRALVYEASQIRVESIPGTDPATGTKLLQAMNIDLAVQAEIDSYGPNGQKYDTLAVINREWSGGDISGRPTYTEIVYPFASVVAAPTITTPSGGTLSRQHQFVSENASDDAIVTFTVERGQQGAGLGEKVTNLYVNEFGLSFSRTGGVELSGSAVAKAILLGQTIDPAPTDIELIPINPGEVSVYVDSTAAALGTTKLTRDFVFEWRLGDRRNPIWPLNGALTSFDGTVETKPTPTARLTMGNDAAGQAFLTAMRAGTRKYVRAEAIGPIIEGSIHYRLTIDMCLLVSEAPGKGDQGGLSTLDWSFRMAHDATWGQPFIIQVVNKITAL